MAHSLNGLRGQLAQIVGDEHVVAGPSVTAYSVDGAWPRLAARPGNQEQVEGVVAACAAAGLAVAPWGGGTVPGIGNPPDRLDVVICLDRLRQVVEFDAANLVVSAEAGLPLVDLARVLAEHGEFLPLDPGRMDRRTVGGAIATNASGPSRLLYGTARDLVLGMRVVLATGERIRCGGKVIKNVSGYDMNKLFIGSLGTLGIITEVTFKLLPLPVTRATVAGVFSEIAQATTVVTRILESFLLPEAMELLNGQAVACAPALGLDGSAGYGLAVSLAGNPETVERQVRDLSRFFAEGQAAASIILDEKQSPGAWSEIRDVLDRAAGAGERFGVKLGVPIGQTAALFAKAEEMLRRCGWRGAVAAHAGSGVVRVGCVLGDGTPPDVVRDAIEALRRDAESVEGSLVVETAPIAVKQGLDAWGNPVGGFTVMRRLKREFDPRSLFNPGRFVGGI
jgi:glycolate oxidase FAD binding subunit